MKHATSPDPSAIESIARLRADVEALEIGTIDATSLQLITALVERVARINVPANVNVGALADRMLAAIPTDEFWHEATGPFYDSKALTDYYGVTRQAINIMENKHKILGLRAPSGRRVLYPTFQFSDRMEPLPRLPEVTAVLGSTSEDTWAFALWLNTPAKRFEGRTAADTLRTGPDGVEVVLSAARADANSRAGVLA